MRFGRTISTLTLALLVATVPVAASQEPAAWIERSNSHAQVLLEVLARFAPEGAGQLGVDGLDEEIFQLPPDINQQTLTAIEGALAELNQRLEAEQNDAVRQDLQILIDAAEQNIEGTESREQFQLPYFNVPQAIFQGLALASRRAGRRSGGRPPSLGCASTPAWRTATRPITSRRWRSCGPASTSRSAGAVQGQSREGPQQRAPLRRRDRAALPASTASRATKSPTPRLKTQLAEYETSCARSWQPRAREDLPPARPSSTPSASRVSASTCRSRSCQSGPRSPSARSRTRCRLCRR